jgi:hypothetical protein
MKRALLWVSVTAGTIVGVIGATALEAGAWVTRH